jgi:spore coat protein A
MYMPRFGFIAITALFASLLTAAAHAQVNITLTATRDNTLYETADGSLSNGQGPDIFAGTNQFPTIRRALVRFNLNAIPPGSVINSASLRLRLNRSRGGTHNVSIHRLLADWGEGPSAALNNTGLGAPAAYGDATWLHTFFDTGTWTSPGGDFVPTASSTTSVSGTGVVYSWTGASVAADVQSWLNNPATNFGWIVRGVETTSSTAKRFDSREASIAANRPQLVITYTPPNSPTGACCLPGGSCTVLSEFYCGIQGGAYLGDNLPCMPAPCGQSVALLTPVKDATLYEDPAGSLGNGAGTGVVIGLGANASDRRRAVMAFDLSSLPASARVLNASLKLTQEFTSDTQSRDLRIHRLNSLWGEGASIAPGDQTSGAPASPGDATWVHRYFNTDTWLAPGGDFDPSPSASTSVGIEPAAATWSGSQLAADVQSWIDVPSSNRGWLLAGDELAPQSQRRFASREAGDAGSRPTLTVTYTLVPATGACCFPEGACAVLTVSACQVQGGTFDPEQLSCTPNPCPQPTGACCLALGTCVILTLPECTDQGGTFLGASASCQGASCRVRLEPFVDPLPIPGIAQPTSGVPGGAAHYDIAMTEFTQKLHRDLPFSRVWGYGGTFPGPTIEARSGQPVTVNWINDLRDLDNGQLRTTHVLPIDDCLHGPDMTGDVPVTVVHLHGAKTTADSDGHPDLTFPPGQQSELYTYPNGQQAGTLWYHDHALGITRLNVYMGLAGFYLLRDAAEDALNLPEGEFEVPLAIQDRSFNSDGSLKYHTDGWHEHFFGEFILVNGKVTPFMNVKRGKYRFRVLNGSGSRAYNLELSDNSAFLVIGTEGGLLPAPVSVQSLTITPGERYDIVIDFQGYSAGTQVLLTNSAPVPFPNGPEESILPDVMKFVVTASLGHTAPIPAQLVPVPPIAESESIRQRDLRLAKLPSHANCPDHTEGVWMIDGLMWDDLTEFPRIGTTEIWAWINQSPIAHPMHMHLVSFQVLDRQSFVEFGDEVVPFGPKFPPAPFEAGWKDTVSAPPGMITRVITRFEGWPGLYPYHCHILEHEDHEMMRQFKLVCPADFNRDGIVNVPDIFAFLSAFFAGDLEADYTYNGTVFTPDIFAFLAAWFAPCP